MIALLVKKHLRTRGLMLGLVTLLLTGMISLHIGKMQIDKHAASIQHTAKVETEQIQRHLNHVDGHIGLLLYYIKFGIANEATPLSGLAIGHRDKRVPAQLVNIRNLQEQINTQELINPYYQLLGNMDLSFVIIYLFPLFIIGVGFNVLSEEKESGTWQLVQSQSGDGKGLIMSKVLIRYASVLLVLLFLLASSLIYLWIPLDSYFLVFALIAILYISFWFALVWFVTSLQYSSSDNALILMSLWIALTIVVPGAVNNIVSYIYPIPEAFGTTISSREGYHSKWDLPKEPTIKLFKKHYPQFESYENPSDQSFSWFWYYAMQQMGDDEAQEEVQSMRQKLSKRDHLSKVLGYINPSMHTQLSMNTLAKSDLTNYLLFRDALTQFHEEKRLHYCTKIFDNIPIADVDWSSIHLSYFKDTRRPKISGTAPLVLIIFLLMFGASFKWNTSKINLQSEQ